MQGLYDRSVKFLDMVASVGNKLKEMGWISGYECDFREATFEWTADGRDNFTRLISTLKTTNRFNEEELEFLRQHLFYFGVVQKPPIEDRIEGLRGIYARNYEEPLTVTDGDDVCEFPRSDLFKLDDWIEARRDREVKIFNSPTEMKKGNWVMRRPPQP
jgi:hypothetical protein